MDQEIRKKEYVQVTAIFTRDGQIIPQEIKLEDGRRFEIDRITDVRRAPSLKAGGMASGIHAGSTAGPVTSSTKRIRCGSSR
jgi:hypothetical protein